MQATKLTIEIEAIRRRREPVSPESELHREELQVRFGCFALRAAVFSTEDAVLSSNRKHAGAPLPSKREWPKRQRFSQTGETGRRTPEIA